MPEQPNAGRGPLGVPTNSPISDPGTSARIQNRPNVPIGTAAPHHEVRKSTARLGGNREVRTDRFPMLKLGARGTDVQRLQRLINIHLDKDEQLKVDGIFGPKTRTAVLEFQREEDLKPDAIVGRDTWFSLISAGTQEASWKAKPPAPPTKVVARTTTTATKKTVDQWTLTERFEYVLQHCAPYLAPDMRAQFMALLTPVNLGIMVSSLAVWAAGHLFGVSEIADAFLLGFGLVFLGKAAIDAARLLKNVVEITCSASTEAELEDAAKNLAEAIAIVGVVTFFALLAKVSRAVGDKMKTRGAAEGAGGGETGTSSIESEKTTNSHTQQTSTGNLRKTSDSNLLEEKTPPEKTAQERYAERKRARDEQLRQAKLKKAIADAEAEGKLNKLDPADRDWLNDDPTGRRKELAYDPDTGSFKPHEAKAALQAEQDGVLKAPVTRAFDIEGRSGGADVIDGDGNAWDIKDAREGADRISERAAPIGGKQGENVLVDCSRMDASDQQALEENIVSRASPPGTGQIRFVPKRN